MLSDLTHSRASCFDNALLRCNLFDKRHLGKSSAKFLLAFKKSDNTMRYRLSAIQVYSYRQLLVQTVADKHACIDIK